MAGTQHGKQGQRFVYAKGKGFEVSGAYYNEVDSFAAAWLRELIKAELIAPGEVDERSIEDVQPDDLRGFTQCHFFAGIGVWSYALRLAGWPDNRPVWTGSCPCPSFSAAGKGSGFEDSRHLWPRWFSLIGESRPSVIFGEQADKAIGFGWLDLIQTDLEAAGYAVGATVLGAHSVGAPHIRQRLYFVADAKDTNGRRPRDEGNERRRTPEVGRSSVADILGYAASNGSAARSPESEQRQKGIAEISYHASRRESGGLADPSSASGPEHEREQGLESRRETQTADPPKRHGFNRGPTNGFWRNCEWLYCRDGKYRPTKPGTPVLATGITNRVGKLRGFGNSIVAPVAQAFIESYMSIER